MNNPLRELLGLSLATLLTMPLPFFLLKQLLLVLLLGYHLPFNPDMKLLRLDEHKLKLMIRALKLALLLAVA